MMQMIEANWIAFALVLAIGLIVAWWLFARGSKGAERSHRPDVLDEGVAPAARNQAYIDAPSATAAMAPPAPPITPPAMAGTMAGIGEVIGVAAQDQVEAAEAEAEAEAEAGPAPAPAPASAADDLRRIKGVGPKLAALLGTLGVSTFAQIAAWDDAEIDRIDAQLGTFAGRIRRDSWVEQAKYLAADDVAGFEARFGKVQG